MPAPIFEKVLVANRGEIACRVMATCQRLGIKTVAVYSTADEQAKHVKVADEGVCIGPPASVESYLCIDKIVDACKRTGAQAVHPGYGFLSENGEFQSALQKNNIIFVGPDAHSIEAMGDKIESKRLAHSAGVTCIPGFIGEVKTHEDVLKFAREVGYPVMIKASGGGGGKGMRVAYNDSQCVEYYDMCKEEAKAAFNSDKMLVEKFIENPRHIEIQVIADRRGNTLYLPERECSIQRRNQKVIEEAPSVLLDAKTRKAMGEEAVAMARAVQYVSAGTVENVVNPQKQFYFLEMNTRLQVEHPITEEITGIDLVEQMLRAAADLPLSITQDDIKINGHATECRVYAEDPMKNYFPSIGRLTMYQEPTGPGVRCDSGIIEGSQISVYYDPLICKLSTWGKDRTECIERMEKALDEYVIRGLRHNICLLRDVVTEPRYQSGDLTTNYLPEQYPNGFKKAELTPEETQLMYEAAACAHLKRERTHYIQGTAPAERQFYVSLGARQEDEMPVYVRQLDDSHFEVAASKSGPFKRLEMAWRVSYPLIRVKDGERETVLQFWGTNEVTYGIQMKGTTFNVNVMSDLQSVLGHFVPVVETAVNTKQVLSPMPGVIVAIKVQPGETVVAGEELLTLEAMKMRNKIHAQADGKVKEIKVKLGATVEDSEVLVELE
ncbi:putative carboxylase [Leishmania mexicana MHOM/GT/2001/U1103]|uniref:propionyl-CoA carboxylase n=1 Tax=Leishmania mexicana (strain MHOM/GT/2001/U1103) TaxID=929439 RepID=E9AJ91_LEIMU|nr:putative carboxylase [Leishmania mexicana MHOM/GT/2001/U1103]CBZ22988.1 putative carboxylase [Leishmania mexicana MHOM/GT/2001/U1103]